MVSFSVLTVIALHALSVIANPLPASAPEPVESTLISRYLANETNLLESRGLETRGGLGNAVVINRCPHDVWLWSVDQNVGFARSLIVPN
jgi:hypothetical protein